MDSGPGSGRTMCERGIRESFPPDANKCETNSGQRGPAIISPLVPWFRAGQRVFEFPASINFNLTYDQSIMAKNWLYSNGAGAVLAVKHASAIATGRPAKCMAGTLAFAKTAAFYFYYITYLYRKSNDISSWIARKCAPFGRRAGGRKKNENTRGAAHRFGAAPRTFLAQRPFAH